MSKFVLLLILPSFALGNYLERVFAGNHFVFAAALVGSFLFSLVKLGFYLIDKYSRQQVEA